MVTDSLERQTAIICHGTLEGDNAVCRGFFNRHETDPLRMAKAMQMIKYV